MRAVVRTRGDVELQRDFVHAFLGTFDVQFNLNVKSAQEGAHEVTLKFDIAARSDNPARISWSTSAMLGYSHFDTPSEDALPR